MSRRQRPEALPAVDIETVGDNALTSKGEEKAKQRRWFGSSPILPPLLTVAAIWIMFLIVVPNFGSVRTLSGILTAASINATVAIGVTLLMIAGEFDLSVGAMMAMGGYLFADILLAGGSPVVAVLVAILVTMLMGSINGVITVYAKIPSFIVTLGTLYIYRGLVWLYSGGLMVQSTETLPIYGLINGRLDILNDLFARASFRTATLWVIVLGVIFQLVLTRTRFGNHIFAVGGNPGAAVALGVNLKRVKITCFILTGALSGLAGAMTFSQFTSVYVSTGTTVELTAIAGAVVGGTLLTGGVGSVIGGLLGILLIDTLRTGVVLLGFPSDNFAAIVGVTIVAVALLNDWIRGRLA